MFALSTQGHVILFITLKHHPCEMAMMNAYESHPVLLYAHPTMMNLARQIVNKCGHVQTESKKKTAVSQLQVPALNRTSSSASLFGYQRSVELCETILWEKFADGFPNLFIKDVKYMAGKDVIFIGSFHSPEVIFEQLSVLYMFPRYLAKSFHFILPYFPTGTMERVDTEGQIATAKTLATLMSAIPLTAKGPAQICVFDIHALQERFYFSESIIPRLESAIPLLLKEVERLPHRDTTVFAFPDDGAFKRFHHYFSEEHSITCVKIRDGQRRIVKVKDGDPEGKHVIIVDDLVQTGGTLKQCGKALLEKGALSVSAYVTHAVFPKEAWHRFIDSEVKFDNFWITDSVPHAIEISQHKPFKLLSLCEPIAEMLIGYDLLMTT
ncbi:hypothetical protein ScPMuIL_007620 [Solemya velum]